MSMLKQPINLQALENELDEAMKADELYQLQNDAKIRAIEQRVPTYEHFRGMVQAAHLRPLERADMQKKPEVSWNHCFKKIDDAVLKTNALSSKAKESSAGLSISDVAPQTSAEFLNIWWEIFDYHRKFEYLLHFKDCLKDKFFKAEVPSEFLGDFFLLGLEIISPDTLKPIIELIEIFSECNRFSLSLIMISASEKLNVEELFMKLLSLGQGDKETEKIKCLAKKYFVSLEEMNSNKKA